ncbi:hypothetical protein BKA93DRAFT_273644 [Sparassis latifolia]
MEPKAAFSRLQLAAALIEYDNDDTDPTKAQRSAHDSAIFAHLRRTNLPRRPVGSRGSTDYLGVALPSETGSVGGLDSLVGDRRSRAGSVDALQNPFGRDSTYEGVPEEEEAEDMEVDLTSWGLDAFIPKDKESKNRRSKAKLDALPNPHPQLPTQGPQAQRGRRPRASARTMSMGYFDSFGEGGAFLDAKSSANPIGVRRHSIGSPLDLPAMQPSANSLPPRRPASVHALIENLPVTPPLHSIPFPTSESVRSMSPFPPEGLSYPRPSSRGSLLDHPAHGRTYSTASLGSRMMLNEEAPNPFVLRPPSPDRASRFDPKAARKRTMSNATMGTIMSPGMPEETNPFAVRPPSPSRSSRFDPKAIRARTVSNGSVGTQMLLDNDAVSSDGSHPPRPHLYSRLELMRPKVLIMPSPLQGTTPTTPSLSMQFREGFEATTDGPPLPPGARTARKSAVMSMLDPSSAAPIASNSFTPNPRQSLTLSQLTFRNTLMVDGQRDVAYTDIDTTLRRATAEGDQIEPDPDEEPLPPVAAVMTDMDNGERSKRPAGKLFGKSLIDDLESRKANMHSKRRVFTGDQRPSMMARTPMQRSSTLIDPESLQRPISQRMDSFKSQPELTRRNSTMKPLIDLNNDIPGAPRGKHLSVLPVHQGDKRSVFGVDTLWERELAKLREIEDRERQEAEERTKLEDAKRRKKKGKKRKGKHREPEAAEDPSPAPDSVPESNIPSQTESLAYILPMIEKTAARPKPPPEDEMEEDSDSSDVPLPAAARSSQMDVEAADWLAGSSDDEDRDPRRTIGSGPRYPSQPPKLVLPHRNDDESSEEDIPLVATIGRAAQRLTRADLDDESDEEKPLSTLLDKTKLKLPSLGGSLLPDTSEKGAEDDDEDNKPLGLRLPANSPNPLGSTSQDADDDRPLAFHPDQMRRTQYMMAQQQQIMIQAQAARMHQSMIFGAPSMMSSGFFGPPIPPPMMMPPQLTATPPPIPDTAKFGRVDRWRHDVAVEGEH